MNGLRMIDIIVLSKVEDGVLSIDLSSISQIDPMIKQRLCEAGMMEEDGKITESGLQWSSAAKVRIEKLSKGILLSERNKNDTKEAENFDSSVCGWLTGTYRKKMYLVNGEIFIIGKPTREMRAIEAGSKTREKVAHLLNRFTAGRTKEYTKLNPFAYQVDPDNGMKLIWTSADGMELYIPIQSMYYDMIKSRFPTATFHVRKSEWVENGKIPVQARVVNRGLKNNVVALLQTVLPGKNIECPINLRGKDGTDVRDERVSIVRQEDDSVCGKHGGEGGIPGGVTRESGIERGSSFFSQSTGWNESEGDGKGSGSELERSTHHELSEVHAGERRTDDQGTDSSIIMLQEVPVGRVEEIEAEGGNSGGEHSIAATVAEERNQESKGDVVLQ